MYDLYMIIHTYNNDAFICDIVPGLGRNADVNDRFWAKRGFPRRHDDDVTLQNLGWFILSVISRDCNPEHALKFMTKGS